MLWAGSCCGCSSVVGHVSPWVWTLIEAEVSLGWKGRDRMRGWDMEVALAACLNFPVLWCGLVRFPMLRKWRNRNLFPVDL